MTHTRGPWRAAGEHVFSVNGRLTITYTNYGTESERLANARRIVDCVNACEGMADPAVEIAALRAKHETVEAELTANEQEVTRLQIALARYGDWVRMANAPAELQDTIDTALATATAIKVLGNA